MAVRKQRATTSRTYALDNDYNKVITQSKKIYRYDEIFYIGTICVGNQVSYVSYSQMDINTNPKIKPIEKWTFEKRWIKETL